MGAHRKIPKDSLGAGRLDRVAILRERLKGQRALRETHEALDFEKRDLSYLRRLNKRIQATRTGLRSAGEDFY